MTREQLKKAWPILEAFKDGKKIEFNYDNCNWRPIIDEIDETCLFKYQDEYRIKPTPKLRPWKPEEVPVGAVVWFAGQKRLIIGTTFDGKISMCDSDGRHVVAYQIIVLSDCKYSIDHGKTWLPCGVEE